jgi:hypothetical protein
MGMFSERSVIGVLYSLLAFSARGNAFTASPFQLLKNLKKIPRGGAAFSTAATEAETECSAYKKVVSKLETITQLSRASAVLGYVQISGVLLCTAHICPTVLAHLFHIAMIN